MYHDPALASSKIAMTNITPQNRDVVYILEMDELMTSKGL